MLKKDRLPAFEFRKARFAFLVGIAKYGARFVINGNISDGLAILEPYNSDRL
jgi:hypothetical protein